MLLQFISIDNLQPFESLRAPQIWGKFWPATVCTAGT